MFRIDDHRIQTSLDLIRSSVIKDLNRRLFHRLNNKICIAMTNLELLHLSKINTDSPDYLETIEETLTATRSFSELIESVSFFLKAAEIDREALPFKEAVKKFNDLISSGIVNNLKFEHENLDKISTEGYIVADTFFLILFTANRLIDIKEKQLNVSLKGDNGKIVLVFPKSDFYDIGRLNNTEKSDKPDTVKSLFLSLIKHLNAEISTVENTSGKYVNINIPVKRD